MSYIDISVPIDEQLLVLPEDPLIKIRSLASFSNEEYNLSSISMSLHSGTHIDASLHYVENGKAISELKRKLWFL